MQIFLAWDGDHIGRQVGRASLNDDVEELRRISQAIDHGNEIWKSWVLSAGGSVISFGGDEGRAEIPADKAGELPRIRDQYQGVVGSTVSVGIGIKLSEADQALLCAKLRGGNLMLFYTPEIADEIDKAQKQPKSEVDKIADEYLNKAAPAANAGAGAGFAGATHPSGPTMDKPVATQGEHSEAQSMYDLLDEDRPPSPEATHAAADFEQKLHDHAQAQDQKDDQAQAQDGQEIEQLKGQVAQILAQVKAQGPVLAQMKQVAPDAYAAVMNMVQAVIAMARKLTTSPAPGAGVDSGSEGSMSKAEGRQTVKVDEKDFYGQDLGKRILEKAWPDRIDDVGASRLIGQLHLRSHKGVNVPYDMEFEYKHVPVEGLPQNVDVNDDAAKRYAAMETEFPPIVMTAPNRVLDGNHRVAAARIRGQKTIPAYVPVTKGEGPIPGAPSHHHLHLPVGSQVADKLKVQHDDGSVSWKEMGAGQIMSQDPSGHPTSSRTPGSR